MNTLVSIKMNIDNFNIDNVDNYNEVRGYSISFNKSISRMVSMSSSKVLVDYTMKLEYLNDTLDEEKVREPIDSS